MRSGWRRKGIRRSPSRARNCGVRGAAKLEARAGYLPSVVADGLYRRRERASDSRLRPDDYSASVRVVQNLYTGGATSARDAIANLTLAKQEDELQAVTDRVTMDVRLAFSELLLNREKIAVRQQSVGVLREELKSQRERLSAGTVGPLDASRAEVALANEEPELLQAETDLKNSYLRLSELCGLELGSDSDGPAFEAIGTLQYVPRHPDLNAALARAVTDRPEVRSAQKDVVIEDKQLEIDQSGTKPKVDVFTGYEAYSERDPNVGPEFNHGYVVGLNASWALFDGFATRGRMQATRARREAALLALKAVKLGSAIRSAQRLPRSAAGGKRAAGAEQKRPDGRPIADLCAEQFRGWSWHSARCFAGLGRRHATRSTRLSAIYLHNAALARLDRAAGGTVGNDAVRSQDHLPNENQVYELTRPPAGLRAKE